jgi:HSP20 family protein
MAMKGTCTPVAVFPRQLSQMQRELEHLLGGFFGPADGTTFAERGWHAPASLWEDEGNLYVELELPGVKSSDVDVTVDGTKLRVKAERKSPEPARKFWHQERTYGALERVVTLPETVNPESVEASLTDGVLHLKVAKRPEVMPRKVVVN